MSDDQKPSTSKGSDPLEQISSIIISTEQENPGQIQEIHIEVSKPSTSSQILKDKRRVSIQSGEGATVKSEQPKEDPAKPSLVSIQGRNTTPVGLENCPKCYAAKTTKNCGESCKTTEPSTQAVMTAEPDPLGLEQNKPQIDVKFCVFPGNRRRGTRGDCPAFAPAAPTERRPVTAPPTFQQPGLLSREEDARALAPFLTRSEQQLLFRLENPPQIQAAASNTTWDLSSLTGDPRLRALLAASNIGETGQGISGLGVTGAAALAKATGLRGLCQCGPPTVPEDPLYRDARGMLARALRESARKRMVCVPMEIDCGGTSSLKIDPPGATNWDWLMQTQRSCPLLQPQGLPQTTAPMLPPDINMPLANQQLMGNRAQFQAPRQAMDPMMANFYNRPGPPQYVGGYQPPPPPPPPPPQYNQQNPQNPYYQPQTQTFGTQTQTNTNYPPPPPPSGGYGQQTYGQQTQTVYGQPGMQNQPNMMNPNTGFMSTQTQQTGYGQGLGQGGTGVGNVSQGIGTGMGGGQGLGNFGTQGQTQGFGTQTQGIGTQGQNFGGQTQAYGGQSQGQYMQGDSFANLFGPSQPSYAPQYPPPQPGGYPGSLPPLYPQPFGQTQQQQPPAPYQPYGQSQQQPPAPYPQPYGQTQQQQQPAPYPQQGFNQPGGQYGSQSQYGNPYQGHQMQQSPYINQPTNVYTCAPSYPPYPGGATGCCPQWQMIPPCPMQSYAPSAPSTHLAQSSMFGNAGAANAMYQHYSEVTASTQVEGSAALALLKKMTSTLPATDEFGQLQQGTQKATSCWCGPPDPSQGTPGTSQQQPPPSPPAPGAGTVSSPMLPAPPGTPTNAVAVCPGKLGLQPGAFCSPLELTLRSCWRTAEGVVTACERTITCTPSSPAQQQQRARTCGPQSLAALSLAVAVRDRRLCLWPASLGATPHLPPPPQPSQNKNPGTGPTPGPPGDPPTAPPSLATPTLTPPPTTQLPPPVTLNTGPWLT